MQSDAKRRGISAVETVLIICMVIVAAIWSCRFFGLTVNRQFQNVSLALADSTEANQHDPAQRTATTTGWIPIVTVAALGCCFLAKLWLSGKKKSNPPQQSNQKTQVAQTAILNELSHQLNEPNPSVQASRLIEKRERVFRALSKDWLSVVNECITAKDIMSCKLTCVPPDEKLSNIARMMRVDDFRHLLVCNEVGKLVGIISDRDLKKSSRGTALHIMTRNPFTVSQDSDINEAISLMLSKRISCVPVVDETRLVGIISSSDIALTLQCTLSLLGRIFYAQDIAADAAACA